MGYLSIDDGQTGLCTAVFVVTNRYSRTGTGSRVTEWVIMAGPGRVGSDRVSGQSYIWTDPVLWPGSRQSNRLIHCTAA